ncbi:MAG TPA: DUF4340 domain-containing protein [Polyangiaceae bacterium]|nr:DUF4340 domain-containing protein [Polyangiaceae bacterium]
MKNEQKIYASAGVLVVALGGLYLAQKSDKDEAMMHSPGAASAQLPDVKLPADDVDKVTKVQIKNAAKGEVVLEKQGDAWKVTKPIAYQANQQNVKSLLDNLKEVKLKDSIDPGKGQYATYELEDDKAVHVQVFKDAAKPVDLFFGKSGTRGQMTRLADKDGVYVASGYSSYLYTREVKDWRDRDIIKFEDGNVISVALTNENGAFSFSKSDDKWTGTYKGKAIGSFDQEKVKDLLRAYKALTAEDFADDKSPADTGLDKPATLTFTLKDNGGALKVNVGKASASSSRYAQKDGTPTTFVLSSFAADWAVAAESKFQKPEAAKDGGAPDKKK